MLQSGITAMTLECGGNGSIVNECKNSVTTVLVLKVFSIRLDAGAKACSSLLDVINYANIYYVILT